MGEKLSSGITYETRDDISSILTISRYHGWVTIFLLKMSSFKIKESVLVYNDVLFG